jgi:tetratricopeptide (TPR) repeat protein
MFRRHVFVNFFGAVAALIFCALPAARAHAAERARFSVVPFVNESGQRGLDYMQGGLPALIAERLARHPDLRFAGPPALVERLRLEEALARAAASGTRFVLAGRFGKRGGSQLAVTVEVHTAGKIAGVGQAVGGRNAVARTALAAALEALAAAGVPTPDQARLAIVAPFARDPYAFVLYGRGVSAYTGIAVGNIGSGERALVPLAKSMVIDPKVPETRRYVGSIDLAAGRPGHARAMWSYAVDLRPDYAAAVLALAALDRTQGLPTARERYARVLELDPDNVEARRAYGELCSEAGQLEQAEAELEKVVAAVPTDLRARRDLALVLAARRAGGALAAELAEIVRLDPDDIDARLELGAAYAAIGRNDAALEAYEEVLRRRPKNAPALKIAADLYRTKGEPAKAALYYEKLRRIAPDDPRPLFLLGASYYDAGRLDAAERMFTEGAHFPGMLGDAYANLGAIAYRRGHLKEALWFLSRAAQRRPGKPGVRYNYALALQAVDRYDDALKELGAAAAAAPNDAEVRFLAGVVSLRMGKLAEAEAAFQEALKIDPGHESAKYNLALLESLHAGGSEGTLAR